MKIYSILRFNTIIPGILTVMLSWLNPISLVSQEISTDISMNGSRVKSFELTPGQTTIDVSDLNSGFYIAQFNINGKITSKKLVIE